MHSWTFTGLVGAFVDLAIVYFLLCASAVAFFASKFLGLFGLSLPCPCSGLFGVPRGKCCLQKLLVDCPTETVSSIQLSVKSNFPFNSILERDQDYHLNIRLVSDGNKNHHEIVEMEDDASCSSISGGGKSQNFFERNSFPLNELEFGGANLTHVKEGKFDVKGKGILSQKVRSGFRRRKKGSSDYGKGSSMPSCNPSCARMEDALQSPTSISNQMGSGIGCSAPPVDSGLDTIGFEDNGEAHSIRNLGERTLQGFELNKPLDKNELTEKGASSSEEMMTSIDQKAGFDNKEKDAIRILEQALEEEQVARAALYLELEKERSAAATAADEAMAMILRLQEEKAFIEMEARQYQRMIEEKSAYDAEEMNILKEILMRREREKHFLEKEVEAYRQMTYLENQQLQDDNNLDNTSSIQLLSSLDLAEDPVLMLHQLSETMYKKERIKDKFSNDEVPLTHDHQKCTLVEKESLVSQWDEKTEFPKQGDQDNQFSFVSSSLLEVNFSDKVMSPLGKQQEHNASELHILHDDESLEQHGEDAHWENKDSTWILDKESCFHDVHVIDGGSNLSNEVDGKSGWPSVNDDSDGYNRFLSRASGDGGTDDSRDFPSTSRLDTTVDVSRKNSDLNMGLPPLGSSRGKALSHLRRESTSTVDNERLKIESEVGLLRERLKNVQEGREKLKFSVDYWERDKIQLQLLEGIACQLREIQQLTEPGKAVRQASLPLPSPKVMSKKRRSRSVSLGVPKSS